MRFAWILALALLPQAAAASSGDGGVFIIAGTGVSTRAYVQFYLENDIGQRTGQLPDGQRVAEIPGTADCYGVSSTANDATGERGSENVEFQLSPFPAGHYKLVLLPLATTAYFLNMTTRNDNMRRARSNFEGYAVAGATVAYSFDFAPTSSSPTVVTKSVTLVGLRQSVQAAFQIGQLGDGGFVSRLDKILAKAQSDIDSGKNKQAADRFDEFIHRLDSAFKKEPDPDGNDDASDKKNASSMKRFVSKTALASLSADARTLIIGLGEQPKK
ncbi:MAG: hypothetical protein HYX59_08435 [Elusimicrobia bacterium]|nr:hypothetical protein [Elusimicrobiota bacterium]